MTDPDEDYLPWTRQIYSKDFETTAKDYAVCRNCDEIRRDHLSPDEKCPFAPSTFRVLVTKVLKNTPTK